MEYANIPEMVQKLISESELLIKAQTGYDLVLIAYHCAKE